MPARAANSNAHFPRSCAADVELPTERIEITCNSTISCLYHIKQEHHPSVMYRRPWPAENHRLEADYPTKISQLDNCQLSESVQMKFININMTDKDKTKDFDEAPWLQTLWWIKNFVDEDHSWRIHTLPQKMKMALTFLSWQHRSYLSQSWYSSVYPKVSEIKFPQIQSNYWLDQIRRQGRVCHTKKEEIKSSVYLTHSRKINMVIQLKDPYFLL